MLWHLLRLGLSFLLTVTISLVTFNIKSGNYTMRITVTYNELLKSSSTLIRLLKSDLSLKGPEQ